MSLVLDAFNSNKELFDKLLECYLDYNSHTNISALREKSDIEEKHFIDSLEILNHLSFETEQTVLDLGAGGGFPVLPLAIVYPKVKFYALDATAKKTKFISVIKDQLNLDNLEILTGRAEDFAHQNSYREQFDFVTARAVAQLNILLELASGFIKPGGQLLSYKAYPIEKEEQFSLNAQAKMNLLFARREIVSEDRQILFFLKQSTLGTEFPREFSKIKNKTL
jgi:16S rRNA (guanine527-N7)-methyltransferase